MLLCLPFQKLPVNLPDDRPFHRVPAFVRLMQSDGIMWQSGKIRDFSGALFDVIGSDNEKPLLGNRRKYLGIVRRPATKITINRVKTCFL